MKINHYKKLPQVLISFLILTYIFLLIKTAWLGDDAYITFRTIDNFVNGYGLRWNISERVQSYTHPLWLFLLASIYFFTREIFFTSLIFSIVISIIAVVILVWKFSPSWENKIIVLLALIFSKAFIDYSTSGLENPLTNLFLVLYAIFYFKDGINKLNVFFLSLLFALIITNRMDCILLVLPSFVYYFFKNKSYKYYPFLILGFLPFILWELFSLWYYGFPFPNTAYAKLNHGISQSEILIEGLKYFKVSFLLDPITLSIILFSVILVFVKRTKILIPLCLGIILYLCYVIWIGGDFMAGRFFTASFLVSLVVITTIPNVKRAEYITLLFIVISTGVLSLNNNLSKTHLDSNQESIVDERLLYYKFSNLLAAIQGKEMPSHNWVVQGKLAKENHLKLVDLYSTGFFGFYAGIDCHIIDKLGLCDPLLSKLTCEMPWRIGHYRRKIPDGYKESLETGIYQIQDTALNEYYYNVKLITRGSLGSVKRLEAIWKMNIGQLKYLLNDYLNSNKVKN